MSPAPYAARRSVEPSIFRRARRLYEAGFGYDFFDRQV